MAAEAVTAIDQQVAIKATAIEETPVVRPRASLRDACIGTEDVAEGSGSQLDVTRRSLQDESGGNATALQAKVDTLTAEADELHVRVDELETENRGLRSQIQEADVVPKLPIDEADAVPKLPIDEADAAPKLLTDEADAGPEQPTDEAEALRARVRELEEEAAGSRAGAPSEVEELRARVIDLEDANKSLQCKVQEADAVPKESSVVPELSAELEVHRSRVAELEGDNEGLRRNIQALETSHETLTAEVEEFRSRIQELQSKPRDDQLPVDNDAVENERQTEAARKALDAEIEVLHLKVSELKGENTGYLSKIQELEAAPHDLTAKNEALQARVEELEGDIADLQSKVRELEEQPARLAAEAEELRGRVGELDGTVASLRDDNEQLKGSIELHIGKVKDVEKLLAVTRMQNAARIFMLKKRGTYRRSVRPSTVMGEEGRDLFRIVNMPHFDKEEFNDREHLTKIVREIFEKHNIDSDGEITWNTSEVKTVLAEIWTLHDCEPWPTLPSSVLSSQFHEVKDESERPDKRGLNVDECVDFALKINEYLSKHMAKEVKKRQSSVGVRKGQKDEEVVP